jgi:hypothetical protein
VHSAYKAHNPHARSYKLLIRLMQFSFKESIVMSHSRGRPRSSSIVVTNWDEKIIEYTHTIIKGLSFTLDRYHKRK